MKKAAVILTKIGLGNFQSTGDYQEVNIRKLTFLYGPNSSGKSSLIDAVCVLRDYWTPTKKEYREDNELEYFATKGRRSLRRIESDKIKGVAKLSGSILVEVEHLLKEEKENKSIINWEGYLQGFLDSQKGFLPITCSLSYFNEERLVEIVMDDQLLVRLADGDCFSINIRHPLFAKSKALVSRLISLVESVNGGTPGNKKLFDNADGLIRYEVYSTVFINRMICQDLNFSFYLEEALGSVEDDESEVFWLIWDAFIELSNVYNEIIERISPCFSEAFSPGVISGSRNIPDREDLTYLIKFGGDQGTNFDSHYYRGLGLSLSGDEKYKSIARSAAFKEISETFGSIIKWSRWDKPDSEVFDAVNADLRDHLLIDKSYQLTAAVSCLFGPGQIVELVKNHALDASGSSPPIGNYIATLMLRDVSNNTYHFNEVGSGIGYVLPILVGIRSKKQSMVEQPELHLHPSLQGALSDVFIEAVNGDRRLIIESHSEHILLRVLRRIRDTTNEKLLTPSLRLSADDVSVLYFDPQADGTTRIKTLRVSPDGDFLDHWPHGFFNERDEDLFDE